MCEQTDGRLDEAKRRFCDYVKMLKISDVINRNNLHLFLFFINKGYSKLSRFILTAVLKVSTQHTVKSLIFC